MQIDYKTVEEVTKNIIDYRGKTPPKTNTGVRLITAKVIKNGRILDNKQEYIAEDYYYTWMRRGLPKQWDILLTTEAPLGEVAQIRNKEKIALAQRIILLRGNPEIINQQYYFQAIKSPFVQEGLKKRATGTTVSGIKQSELRKVKIPVPSLPTQHKIAGILSAYDDLIENKTRRIQILEEMAQRIYREWFVHFKFPGHENVKMVKSELGMIPEGWRVKKIEDIYTTGYGGTPSRKKPEYYDGNIPWLKTKELNDNIILDTEEKITKLGLSKSSAKIFPEHTVIMAMYGATIGKLGMLSSPTSTNQACCAFMPKEDVLGHTYIFSQLFEKRNEMIGHSMGAAQQNLSQILIKKFKILKPDYITLQRYTKECIIV